jgi:tetratricopeptide (TPR) repeat protein
VGAVVSEETEGQDAGAEAVTGGVDPAAIALALGGASREDAHEFLKKQGALIDDQRHHLHEQLKQLKLGIWEKRLGVLLRVATAIMGFAIAAGLGFMVWQAAHSNELLFEPFSVPPDLASRGLTGNVVAAKVLDRLALMQKQTSSQRPARTYVNSWSEHDIKLEIPETGVSLAELDSWLRGKLGRETHVTGDVVHTASGVALTARAGEDGAESVTGSQDDMDALTQQLAESLYRLTQPFRYAMYLTTHGRADEADLIFQELSKSDNREDRIWGLNRWAVSLGDREGIDAELRGLEEAVTAEPDNMGAWTNLVNMQIGKSRPEEAVRAAQTDLQRLSGKTQTYVLPANVPGAKRRTQAYIDEQLGAFEDARQVWAPLGQSGYPGLPLASLLTDLAVSEIGTHDLTAARETVARFEEVVRQSGDGGYGTAVWPRMIWNMAAENWSAMLVQDDANVLGKTPRDRSVMPTTIVPPMAYAEARLGRFAAAEARIAATPADCYVCLRMHARIAEVQGQHTRADGWFARAVSGAPSIPFAYADWGQALLARGMPDAAIEKFKLANWKGPHFADPLEGWGEALMAKNQSHLALKKFAEAEKYAPNWGRLHLKWGEALYYSGKRDEAKVQFARAAQLDLTPADKTELARQSPHA